MADKFFSPEQSEYLRQHVKNISNSDLAVLMNNSFGLSLTRQQINTYKKNHNLRSGLDGRFQKGHIPANKNKKYPDMPHNTGMFTKGQKPHNHLPVGTELMKSDGYIWVKIKEPNKWRQKHVLLWEDVHGKKPRGMKLLFADGDRQNFDIDNIILVSSEEVLIMNRKSLIMQDRELTKSGVLLAKVYAKMSRRKRERKCNHK
jgi:hypothetical protein